MLTMSPPTSQRRIRLVRSPSIRYCLRRYICTFHAIRPLELDARVRCREGHGISFVGAIRHADDYYFGKLLGI